MTGYFSRLAQRYGVAPAPGPRAAPAEGQFSLERKEWRETAPPVHGAAVAMAAQADAAHAIGETPAGAFPSSETRSPASGKENRVGPSATPVPATTETAPTAARGRTTPSVERSAIETEAVEEAPLQWQASAAPPLDGERRLRPATSPTEWKHAGTETSSIASAVAIPWVQELSSRRAAPPQERQPTTLPLAAERSWPQDTPAVKAVSPRPSAPEAREDEHGAPIEVRIGTVSIEMRAPPPPAPPQRAPAPAAQRRDSARFSPSRYYLRRE